MTRSALIWTIYFGNTHRSVCSGEVLNYWINFSYQLDLYYKLSMLYLTKWNWITTFWLTLALIFVCDCFNRLAITEQTVYHNKNSPDKDLKIQGVFSKYLNKLVCCLILLSSTLICCSVAQLLVHLSRNIPDAAALSLAYPEGQQRSKIKSLLCSGPSLPRLLVELSLALGRGERSPNTFSVSVASSASSVPSRYTLLQGFPVLIMLFLLK